MNTQNIDQPDFNHLLESPRKISKIKTENFEYLGSIKDQKPDKFGVLIKNEFKQIGCFKEGNKHGPGVIINQNNHSFIHGTFTNNTITGIGVKRFQNGDIYFGELKKNVQSGKGVYYDFARQKQVLGCFNDDKITKVEQTGSFNPDALSINTAKGKHLVGIMSGMSEDAQFEGWVDASRSRTGQGYLFWGNGDRFHGYFQNDRPHGQGVFQREDGMILQSTFNKGAIDGEAVVQDEGNVYSLNYTNGQVKKEFQKIDENNSYACSFQ